MKGFIEVTNIHDNCRELIAVREIITVSDYTDSSFIRLDTSRCRKKILSYGFYAKETYDEVIAKIKEAIE